MTRWVRGEVEIADLVRAGSLQQVTGSQTDGSHLLDKARRIVDSAAKIVDSDADSAYVLAYDAARHAGTALLAHQGLRPMSKGGHDALDLALKAQFSPGFESSRPCVGGGTNSSTQNSPTRRRTASRLTRLSRTRAD